MSDHLLTFANRCKTLIATQKDMARFLMRYPDKWHSYASGHDTVEQVCGLVNLGIAEINDSAQMRLKSPEKAARYIA